MCLLIVEVALLCRGELAESYVVKAPAVHVGQDELVCAALHTHLVAAVQVYGRAAVYGQEHAPVVAAYRRDRHRALGREDEGSRAHGVGADGRHHYVLRLRLDYGAAGAHRIRRGAGGRRGDNPVAGEERDALPVRGHGQVHTVYVSLDHRVVHGEVGPALAVCAGERDVQQHARAGHIVPGRGAANKLQVLRLHGRHEALGAHVDAQHGYAQRDDVPGYVEHGSVPAEGYYHVGALRGVRQRHHRRVRRHVDKSGTDHGFAAVALQHGLGGLCQPL